MDGAASGTVDSLPAPCAAPPCTVRSIFPPQRRAIVHSLWKAGATRATPVRFRPAVPSSCWQPGRIRINPAANRPTNSIILYII